MICKLHLENMIKSSRTASHDTNIHCWETRVSEANVYRSQHPKVLSTSKNIIVRDMYFLIPAHIL